MATTLRRPRAQAAFTVGGYPPALVFETDFETWPGSAFPFNAPLNWYVNIGVGSTRGAAWDRNSAGAGSDNVASFTGLVIGRSYTLSLSARRWNGAATPGFGFAIGGATSAVAPINNSYVTRSVTFTASATSHSLTLTCNAAALIAIDNVTLQQAGSGAGTTTVPVLGGDVSLDRSRVPYGRARLDVALTDLAAIETLDPRNNLRVTVTASDLETGQSRAFNLGLSERTVNHKTRRLTLQLATDEAMLMRHRVLTDDDAPFALASSLRAVVNNILGKVIPGASLAGGGPDADVTPTWAVTTMHTNPEVVNGYGFGIAQNSTNLRRVTFGALGAIATDAVAAGTSNMVFSPSPDTFRVTPGRWYVAGIMSSSAVARQARCGVQFYAGAGQSPMQTVWGAYKTQGTGSPSEYIWVVARAPAGAQSMVPFISTEGNTAGQIQYARLPMIHEGTRPVNPFTGNTPMDAAYDYGWAESVHGSPSLREPLQNTPDPDALVWKAGSSAWEFLEPLVTRAGFRLFCDEQRIWRMVDAGTYTVAGSRAFGPSATDGSDMVTIDNPDVHATGAIVRYHWRDRDGIQQEELDVAGTAGIVAYLTRNEPWPGPGAAAKVLAARTLGREQEVTAPSDLTVTPGMAGTVTLPGTVSQSGRITAVEWNLSNGLMRPRVRQAA